MEVEHRQTDMHTSLLLCYERVHVLCCMYSAATCDTNLRIEPKSVVSACDEVHEVVRYFLREIFSISRFHVTAVYIAGFRRLVNVK